jgi:putative heme iron utilization protein
MPNEPPPANANSRPEAIGHPVALARRLLRAALKASLATLDPNSGHPYASLVLIATEPDGTPTFLVSRLARHTRNLQKDARASLLIGATEESGDPLAGARITLLGEARPCASATARPRFLARHPAAAGYAEFADFAMYGLAVEGAHLVAGFGRIVDLAGPEITLDTSAAGGLIAAEPDILAHMNADHSEAVALYATALAGAPPGPWRMSGIDPEGIDLLHRDKAARVAFPRPILTPAEARACLAALAQQARGLAPSG